MIGLHRRIYELNIFLEFMLFAMFYCVCDYLAEYIKADANLIGIFVGIIGYFIYTKTEKWRNK